MQLFAQPLFLTETFGNQHDWFLIPLVTLVLCVIHLVVASFFPPSPKHLYLNLHQEEYARQSIKFYQGRDAKTGILYLRNVYIFDLDQTLSAYECERLLLRTEHMTLKDICRNENTRWAISNGLVRLILNVRSQFPVLICNFLDSRFLLL